MITKEAAKQAVTDSGETKESAELKSILKHIIALASEGITELNCNIQHVGNVQALTGLGYKVTKQLSTMTYLIDWD